MGININIMIIIIVIIVVVIILLALLSLFPWFTSLAGTAVAPRRKKARVILLKAAVKIMKNLGEPMGNHGRSSLNRSNLCEIVATCCQHFFCPDWKNKIRAEHARYLWIEHHFFFANPCKSPSFWPGLWKPRKERRHRGCAWGISMLSFRDVSSVAS